MTNVRTDARGFAMGIKSADEARTQELVNAFNHACEGHLNGEILFALAAVAGVNIALMLPRPEEQAVGTLGFYLLLNDVVRRTNARRKAEPEGTQ